MLVASAAQESLSTPGFELKPSLPNGGYAAIAAGDVGP